MAPVVAMIDLGDMVNGHDGRHEWRPYDGCVAQNLNRYNETPLRL
jgi:hypothetical protein